MHLRALALLVCFASLPAAAATVDLKNGDKVSGEVVESTDAQIVVEHPVLGRLVIPRDQVVPPDSKNPGLFGTSFLAGWTRTFLLGVSGAQGNSKNTDITAALDLDYADDTRRWAFDAAYQFSAADGDTSENNARLALRRDWLLSDSSWFFFARGLGAYDEFENWTWRLQGAGGVGYEFVKTETWSLQGLVGPSLMKEFDQNEFYVEALASLESVWTFSKNHSFSLSNTIYPALNHLGEFRNVSALGWKWRLAEEPALSLNVGVANEYESDVESDIKHNDLRYTTSLGIDF